MLEHGGNLLAAAKRYGIDHKDWLDLSTGINPNTYPVREISSSVWRRLPQADDGLQQLASVYYGTPYLLPASGSQAILQALPYMRPPCRIAVPIPTYAEHPKAWRAAGHQVLGFPPERVASILDQIDVLLLCHPNNPSGHCYSKQDLLDWHRKLAAKGGWLIVDEAFIDVTPEASLADHIGVEGLIVLRSLGKFFGLAGARVGFMLAWPEMLLAMQEWLGPWQISGPSREIASQALADKKWQIATRKQLQQAAQQLSQLLIQSGLTPVGVTALFQWVITPQAEQIHQRLAAQGILTRLFDLPNSLRFGLPGVQTEWQRLSSALQKLDLSD